jgi:predicted nucleotidyltransferase
MTEPTFILRGIGGSHAHGLATAASDVDMVGVYSWPTSAFWRLQKPAESFVKHAPFDEAYHDLAKFLSLAAKSNPTVLETLWLDDYTEIEPFWGQGLLHIRKAFASERYVLKAFVGYAESQFRKMMTAGDELARARTPKHATHMLRLLEQGRALYETGFMPARVANPDQYREWATWSTARLAEEFTRQWEGFLNAKSALPEEPDWVTINNYLHEYRKAHV